MPQIIESNERIYQWEFVTGKILQLYSFRSLPDISLDGIFLNPFSKKDNKIQRYYRPSDSNKIAILFGPHHVYTFDGHLYDSAEYSSDCTFLLGHDLRKSAFTVLSDKNAIHVLFPEMAISVNGENEVFINGSTTSSNLPIESNNGKIVVRRSDVVEIWSPSLKVICSSRDFLCVLELDSWHNGETFGLLGNADGSSSNEFMLPDGKPTSNVLNFVTDYEVSGNSECQNLHLPIKSPHSYEAEETCSSHFRNLCQFNKNTFEAFLDVCKSNFKESDACYATTGYASLCYFKNLPSITDCNVKKQVNRRIEKKLEVVLIINEHRLMAGTEKSLFYKGMERMFTALNDKFKTNGYSSVLFSVVGFGGKGARYQPTVYAKGRDSWMPLKALLDDVLESLQFDGKEDADILKILKFSLDVMGYDSFNSKIFIVLTTKDRQSKNKQVISTLQHNLEKNGITLYTFSSYPSIEKGMKVYGVRGDGLMFPSPKKGEDAYLDYPRGDLAKLTSATRGSIFLSKFIQANKPAAFFREVANEVWNKINKESQICRECSTVRSNWWWQVNECNIVHC
ncbi:apolipoprotein B-100 [Caerostris darwini]|uniref:Apolipoprotein B-100 n=1 Tax=Caerostris darwini TaxID=1538125 RepID=A0AAV4MEB0_9ARAC|nr:apolipoprotein B-100 [Caerostris darwini]